MKDNNPPGSLSLQDVIKESQKVMLAMMEPGIENRFMVCAKVRVVGESVDRFGYLCCTEPYGRFSIMEASVISVDYEDVLIFNCREDAENEVRGLGPPDNQAAQIEFRVVTQKEDLQARLTALFHTHNELTEEQ